MKIETAFKLDDVVLVKPDPDSKIQDPSIIGSYGVVRAIKVDHTGIAYAVTRNESIMKTVCPDRENLWWVPENRVSHRYTRDEHNDLTMPRAAKEKK